MRNYLQHGSRHRLLGTDPITGLVSAGYLWGVQGNPLSISTGTPTRVPWAHFNSTDSRCFSTDTTNGATAPYHDTAGDTYIYLTQPGSYLAIGSCAFQSGAYEQAMLLEPVGGQFGLADPGDAGGLQYTFPFEEFPDNTPPSLNEAQYGLTSRQMYYVDPGSSAGIISMKVEQSSGGGKNLSNASLGIFYFGPDGSLATVY